MKLEEGELFDKAVDKVSGKVLEGAADMLLGLYQKIFDKIGDAAIDKIADGIRNYGKKEVVTESIVSNQSIDQAINTTIASIAKFIGYDNLVRAFELFKSKITVKYNEGVTTKLTEKGIEAFFKTPVGKAILKKLLSVVENVVKTQGIDGFKELYEALCDNENIPLPDWIKGPYGDLLVDSINRIGKEYVAIGIDACFVVITGGTDLIACADIIYDGTKMEKEIFVSIYKAFKIAFNNYMQKRKEKNAAKKAEKVAAKVAKKQNVAQESLFRAIYREAQESPFRSKRDSVIYQAAVFYSNYKYNVKCGKLENAKVYLNKLKDLIKSENILSNEVYLADKLGNIEADLKPLAKYLYANEKNAKPASNIDISSILNQDGTLKNRNSWGFIKNMEESPLKKELKKKWVDQFADKPVRISPNQSMIKPPSAAETERRHSKPKEEWDDIDWKNEYADKEREEERRAYLGKY